MLSSVTDRDRAARGGFAAALATLAGALLLVVALLASLVFVIDIFGRIGANRPLLVGALFDRAALFFGLGFALAALLALPAALTAPFRRAGSPPLRSQSALALVPGCLVALAILFVAIVYVVALGGAGFESGSILVYRRAISTFTEIAYLLIPMAVMLAAALGGGRTPESTAAAAGPIVLAGLSGMIGGLSITSLMLGMLLPLLAAAVVLAILYAMAPARAVTPWLAGIALVLGMMLLTATGSMTPTEAIGFIALFALPITLLVRALALRQPIGAILRQAAMETVSLVVVIAASAMVAVALALAQLKPGLGESLLSSPAFMIGGGAAFLVASYLLTPALALGLALPLAFAGFRGDQLDQAHVGVVLVLLGLAAIAARAGRPAPVAPAQGLPTGAALMAASLFVVLALAVALVPEFALSPVRALLR